MNYRKGNLILFDHRVHSETPRPFLRGIVDRIEDNKVILESEFIAPLKCCAGIPMTEFWNEAFQYWPKRQFTYVHELQNYYADMNGEMLRVKIKKPL